VLKVARLAKRYGEVWAVRELTVSVGAGETLVLLGRNGAGKSTALRCMAGVIQPTTGRVEVGGLDLAVDADRARGMTGAIPEVPGLYERMPARAYLDWFGRVYELEPAVRRRRIEELLERFDLSADGDRWLGSFSKGMRQKVALIRATLHRPRLLLADEPTSALDPDSKRVAWSYLEELRSEGAALVVCTHDMEEASELAGAVGIMDGGRLLARGTWAQLVAAAGLERRQEVVDRPTLENIYLAIVAKERHAEKQPVAARTA
jgi:ABC-2 type transport system ATP-binding protein